MHTVKVENAAKVWSWLHERGGIAVWPSVNLSNPGASWTTPACNEDGSCFGKPTWQAANEPKVITDPAEVAVSFDKEVRRFRIGIRRGAQGFSMKVTDAGTRRIRAAVEKAGEGAYYVFDYNTQEAIIMAPEKTLPISEWRKQHVSHAAA